MRFLSYLAIISLFITGYDLHAQVYINEILASNSSVLLDEEYNDYSDWIELYNADEDAFELGAYYLSDDFLVPNKWKFEEGTTIPAGGYLIIWADDRNTGLHANFKLSSSGEQLGLYDPSLNVIDSLTFGHQSNDISYGRITDGNPLWSFFSTPTPNLSNDSYQQNSIAPTPQIEPEAGFYTSSQTVTITVPSGNVIIRYTIDGSEPTEQSVQYTSSFTLNNTIIVRARAFGNDYLPSTTASNTYFINEPDFTLPVVSLSTAPANLWDDMIGIYTVGTNGIPGNCVDYPVNWNQDWERPVSFEFFDEEKAFQLQQNAGIKIYGGCTRGFDQKSVAIISRNIYGKNRLDYKFFEDKPITRFKSIVLRNSGNDWGNTMLRDIFMQALVKDRMDIDYQAYQPSITFLNGEYWGILNIREKINEHYVAGNANLDEDNVNLLEGSGTVLSGEGQNYENLISYVEENDLSDDEVYEYIKTQIDIEEYINYMITQIFIGNTDWPGNNIKYWQPSTDFGRWRWILFDLDFGFHLYNTEVSHNTLAFALEEYGSDWPNPSWSTFLFRNLVQNEEFKNQFIQCFAYHLNTTFDTERVIAVLDSTSAVITPEMQRHIDRWGTPGNIFEWEYNLERLKDFAYQRPDFVRQHIREVFDLPGIANLIINNTDTVAGKVLVNGYPINDTVFIGSFFQGISLPIQVAPNKGYELSHWKITPINVNTTTIINQGANWKYLDNGSDQDTIWRSMNFNDSSWSSGNAQLGYGDGDETTVIGFGVDPDNKYITSYFRKSFIYSGTDTLDNLVLRLMRDDGAVIYINGQEVVRSNMPEGDIDYLTTSITYVGDADEYTFYDFLIEPSILDSGTNIIAVEIHQTSPTSSDVSFDLELLGSSYSYGTEEILYDYPLNLSLEGGTIISPVFTSSGQYDSIYINEFMASNQSALYDDNGELEDWVELYNAGHKPVNIAGLYLTDDFNMSAARKIPDTDPVATTIQPGGFLLLYADQDTTQGVLHLNFRLNNEGEQIGLLQYYNDEYVMIDSISYNSQMDNVSYGRYPDGTQNLTNFGTITPELSNIYSPVYVNQITYNISDVNIYPNPTTGNVKVKWNSQWNSHNPLLKIDIFSITGQLLLSESYNNFLGNEVELNISDFTTGLYIVCIHSNTINITGKIYKR